MNATVSEPGTLTTDPAVREILRIEGNTRSLLHRTIGLTWMIWAVLSGGIFVSYEAIGIAAPSGWVSTIEYGFAWLPWAILGTVATTVRWRSLALVVPLSSGKAAGITLGATVAFLAGVFGGFGEVPLAHVAVLAPAWAMFAIGVAAAVVGGSGLTTDSRSERVFWLGGGASLAVLTIGIGLLAAWRGYDPLGLLLVVGPVASTALLFAGGLYTASGEWSGARTMSPEPLDPAIHQAVRLRRMVLLSRNRAASFVWVRDALGLTDGNLGSHVARLVAAGYAVSSRVLTRSGFQVWLRITPSGDAAYRAYLASLRSNLEPMDSGPVDPAVDGAPRPRP